LTDARIGGGFGRWTTTARRTGARPIRSRSPFPASVQVQRLRIRAGRCGARGR
jgi:hypothetical protein